MPIMSAMTLPRPPRMFFADDILSGQVNLDGYPFTFLRITPYPQEMMTAPRKGREAYLMMIDKVFSAAELLETRGWQVVNFEGSGELAYMRRVVH